jgi:hypothetical protein
MAISSFSSRQHVPPRRPSLARETLGRSRAWSLAACRVAAERRLIWAISAGLRHSAPFTQSFRGSPTRPCKRSHRARLRSGVGWMARLCHWRSSCRSLLHRHHPTTHLQWRLQRSSRGGLKQQPISRLEGCLGLEDPPTVAIAVLKFAD